MNNDRDADDEKPLTADLLEYFHRVILAAPEAPLLDIHADRCALRSFDAGVDWNGRRGFTLSINDGCVEWIHRALDVTDAEDLRVARGLAKQIFADETEVGPILEGLMNLAVLFIVLHEYAHVICGHLHADAAAGPAPSERSFRELGAFPRARCFHLAVSGVSALEIDRVFELEADAAAFEMLKAHAFELLRASESTTAVFDEADDHRAAELAAIAERMAFLAASLVAALTEMAGSAIGDSGTHPPALVRILSLCLTNVIMSLPYEWHANERTHVLLYGDAEEEALLHHIVPMIADAVDLGRIGCVAVGVKLRLRYDASLGNRSFARAFASDFSQLLAGRPDLLETDTAREYATLEAARQRMLSALAPHRQVDWWKGVPTDPAS